MNPDSGRLHVRATLGNVGIAYSWEVRCVDGEFLLELFNQRPLHSRGLCVAVQEGYGGTLTRLEVMNPFPFDFYGARRYGFVRSWNGFHLGVTQNRRGNKNRALGAPWPDLNAQYRPGRAVNRVQACSPTSGGNSGSDDWHLARHAIGDYYCLKSLVGIVVGQPSAGVTQEGILYAVARRRWDRSSAIRSGLLAPGMMAADAGCASEKCRRASEVRRSIHDHSTRRAFSPRRVPHLGSGSHASSPIGCGFGPRD